MHDNNEPTYSEETYQYFLNKFKPLYEQAGMTKEEQKMAVEGLIDRFTCLLIGDDDDKIEYEI
ncbi:hypothetical protein EPJ70_00810 [Brachyspira aalborgi]|uniref:Uncharacterized protein n=1 Tax=Brachyspira aalborgi TaxID=29522 RepID=A0A5C8F8Y3_9SPIR|nr:hypothetical protein [Brachyspira aalborgi]TXJ46715.1 hypothetical protein EPJ70_00810 [Brachyspira aalborgi]